MLNNSNLHSLLYPGRVLLKGVLSHDFGLSFFKARVTNSSGFNFFFLILAFESYDVPRPHVYFSF